MQTPEILIDGASWILTIIIVALLPSIFIKYDPFSGRFKLFGKYAKTFYAFLLFSLDLIIYDLHGQALRAFFKEQLGQYTITEFIGAVFILLVVLYFIFKKKYIKGPRRR
ncbi:MAG: hypothetical protein PHD13_07000 [Methanocellales archaeon]|nr:hypothetical protein [Methanocellales archaeon]MDD3292380.1 hypothetical protein [Methanocellales archaeon]MDD5235907.1 hypothetical protein [Methanocellales archaeon]MDD5485868.1 hypothetical protein [Methanocellales archaeon]